MDYLNPLVPFFKISSSDITNTPLLRKISKKRKPIVLSTGAASINEIKNALKVLNKNLKVMDLTAISLAKETKIPILVTSIFQSDSLINALKGIGEYSTIN